MPPLCSYPSQEGRLVHGLAQPHSWELQSTGKAAPNTMAILWEKKNPRKLQKELE